MAECIGAGYYWRGGGGNPKLALDYSHASALPSNHVFISDDSSDRGKCFRLIPGIGVSDRDCNQNYRQMCTIKLLGDTGPAASLSKPPFLKHPASCFQHGIFVVFGLTMVNQ